MGKGIDKHDLKISEIRSRIGGIRVGYAMHWHSKHWHEFFCNLIYLLLEIHIYIL